MNKLSQFCAELSKHTNLKPLIHVSPASGYRARSEFGFSKDAYTMIKDARKIYMNTSNIPHSSIQKIMSKLVTLINASEIVKKKLFQVNFRTTGSRVLVSLVYHRPLDEDWKAEALKIKNALGHVSIIGRSKKAKILIGDEVLEITYEINGSSFKILQNDLVFFQPNIYLYPLMMEFITSRLESPKDLLELYCGCGGLP